MTLRKSALHPLPHNGAFTDAHLHCVYTTVIVQNGCKEASGFDYGIGGLVTGTDVVATTYCTNLTEASKCPDLFNAKWLAYTIPYYTSAWFQKLRAAYAVTLADVLEIVSKGHLQVWLGGEKPYIDVPLWNLPFAIRPNETLLIGGEIGPLRQYTNFDWGEPGWSKYKFTPHPRRVIKHGDEGVPLYRCSNFKAQLTFVEPPIFEKLNKKYPANVAFNLAFNGVRWREGS